MALLHRILPARFSAACLLAASLFYYAVGAPAALPILIGVALVVYGSGRWLAWLRQRQKGMRAVLGVCIAATTAGLAVCKYADLFTTTAQRALHTLQIPVTLQAPNFLLPMGISFLRCRGFPTSSIYTGKSSPWSETLPISCCT